MTSSGANGPAFPDIVEHAEGELSEDKNGARSRQDAQTEMSETTPCRQSKTLLVGLVFVAMMLDGLLWTIVVPILPSYLRDLEANRGSEIMLTTLSPVSDDAVRHHDEDDVTTRRFALASDSFYEWVDGSSRPADSQWLWERWLWLRRNWSEAIPNVMNNSTFDEDTDSWLMDADGQSFKPVPDFQREDHRIGLLLSAKAIVQMMANPVVGFLVNRFGHKIPLIFGMTVIMTSSLVYAVGVNYALLVVARGIHGLGSSCLAISGMAALARNYADGELRSRAMGVALGGCAAGVIVGYPFGGVSNAFFGITAPFLSIAAIALLEIVLLVWTFSPLTTSSHSASENQETGKTPVHRLLRDPYILIATGALFIPEMCMGTLESTVPAWMLDTMSPEKWQLGTVFVPDSIGFFIGCTFTSYIVHRVGPWRVQLIALLAGGISLFAIPFAKRVVHLIAPHFFFGLSLGVTDATIMPLMAHLVDVRYDAVYGSVYAIATFAISIGFAVGPIVNGQLVEIIGFKWLFFGMAALSVIYAPLCCLLQDRNSSDEQLSILANFNRNRTSSTCTANNRIADRETFNYQPLH